MIKTIGDRLVEERDWSDQHEDEWLNGAITKMDLPLDEMIELVTGEFVC